MINLAQKSEIRRSHRASELSGQFTVVGAGPASEADEVHTVAASLSPRTPMNSLTLSPGPLRSLLGVAIAVLCCFVVLSATAPNAAAQDPIRADDSPSRGDQLNEPSGESGDGDEDSGGEDSEEESSEEPSSEDSEDDGGFLQGIGVNMLKEITGWIEEGVEAEAQKRTADLVSQLTSGRYMMQPPSNGLTDIYRDTADWAKYAAIPLLLLLGLSMCLRGANYDTAYAVQTGIPKIVTVLAGIAFMPEIIGVIADMTRSIAEAVVDVEAMQQGFETLSKEESVIKVSPALTIIVWLIKGILSVLLLLAVAVQKLIFGLLYIVGPLALIFHAIPKFSDVAAAWLRGILASFVISILWALEFGFGYRLVGDPSMLYSGTGWRTLPLILSLGILWLAWKTPWWVYQWAFYSYSAGGGGGGLRGAMSAISLFKLFKK